MTRFLSSIFAAILLGLLAYANGASAQMEPVPTVLTLSSSANPSLDSELVTITARVTSEVGIPQGRVTFFDGATELPTVSTGGSEFPLILSGLSAGTHTISAVFVSDDGQWLTSEGSLIQTVERNPALPTTTSLTTSANPAVAGDGVSLTATVTASSGTPTGDVEFYNGPLLLGTGTLDASGVATANTVFSDQGARYLTARYVGLPTQFFESTSEPLEQLVEPRPPQQTVTTLTSSRNPSREQQLVTITAKVTSAEGTPTGYIEFKEDGVTVATAELYDGIATYNTSPPFGSHTITAHYAGALSLFEPSSSEPLTQVVYEFVPQTEPTVTTLTSSPNPADIGELVALTVTVTSASGVPTGRVELHSDSPSPTTAMLDDSGVATFYYRYGSPGEFEFTAQYLGETSFLGSTSATLNQYVSPGGTTPTETVLTASQNPSTLGQGVTFTASVVDSSPNARTVIGNVSFIVDGTVLGRVRLIDGVASFGPTTQLLSAGPHNVRALYLGSYTFATSSAALTQSVAGDLIQTSTSVTSTSNNPFQGQPITLTATVAPVTGNVTPTGTVEFFIAGTSLGTAALDQSGQAQRSAFPISGATIGTNNITAVYSGSIIFATSTSPVYLLNIIGNSTTTTVTSSSNPSSEGQEVTFVAIVTPSRGFVSGSVFFYDGADLLGFASVNGSGFSQFSTSSLSAGAHAITAKFREDFLFQGSVSEPLNQVVNATSSRLSTETYLRSSPNPSKIGDTVRLIARVGSVSDGGAPNFPEGTVQFFDNANFLGSAEVSDQGGAQLEISSLTPGLHSLTAVYSGNHNFETSASTEYMHTVESVELTVDLEPRIATVVFGAPVLFSASVQERVYGPSSSFEFFEGTKSLGVILAPDGVANINISDLVVGSHFITVVYSPNIEGYSNNSSSTAVLTVGPGRTSIELASSKNPSSVGEEVTLTANVTIPGITSSGVVSFFNGTTKLGEGELTDGVASLVVATFTIGEHSLTAKYDANSLSFEFPIGGTSAPLLQSVGRNRSDDMDNLQRTATSVAARLASELITDSVADEVSDALSGQVNVVSASDGRVGLTYQPGMGKGSIITPTADVAQGESDLAKWRIWTSLRYADFDSTNLEGDQIHALFGTTFLFGDGLVAGLVAGYEKQNYEDSVNATLKGEGFNIGGYVGGTIVEGLRFDAQAHSSFLDYDLASGPVTAETDATRLMLSGGFAHMMQLGATTFEPTARFNGTSEWQDGYTDSAAVAHGKRDFYFGHIATGAKLAHRIDLGDGASVSPYLQGFADYRFSGGDFTNESLMDGLSARIGLGASLNTASGISASVLAEFSGLGLNDNVTVQSYKAQIAIPF